MNRALLGRVFHRYAPLARGSMISADTPRTIDSLVTGRNDEWQKPNDGKYVRPL
ncbi:MAG: hypothetical protein ACT4QC_01210 [Planctomycetaceae bacterium]